MLPPAGKTAAAADQAGQSAGQLDTAAGDLICTCPHPPAPPPRAPAAPAGPAGVDSYSVIATAAILPPPPSFLCPEMSVTGQVQTVPINKVQLVLSLANQ